MKLKPLKWLLGPSTATCATWEKKGTWAESFHPFIAAHMFAVGGDRFYWSKVFLRSFIPVFLGWLDVCLVFFRKNLHNHLQDWPEPKKNKDQKSKKRCLSSGEWFSDLLCDPHPLRYKAVFKKNFMGPSYKVIAAATAAMIHSWSFCFFLRAGFNHAELAFHIRLLVLPWLWPEMGHNYKQIGRIPAAKHHFLNTQTYFLLKRKSLSQSSKWKFHPCPAPAVAFTLGCSLS